jgi:hypothetical protein
VELENNGQPKKAKKKISEKIGGFFNKKNGLGLGLRFLVKNLKNNAVKII